MQRVNKLFESKSVDKLKLFDDLLLLLKSVAKRLIMPTANVDVIKSDIANYLDPKPNLGYRFENKIDDMKKRNVLTASDETMLRQRCQKFLMSLFKQLRQRLPESLELLKYMSLFSVSNMLKAIKDVPNICKVMRILGASDDAISQADYQLSKINLVDWVNKTDTEKFWCEVSEYKDASGSMPFSELYESAVSALILPHSNADIERVFSIMNSTKSKARNRMKLKLLNSILTVKFGLLRKNKCCFNYVLPARVIKDIGTLASYQYPQINVSGPSSSNTAVAAAEEFDHDEADDVTAFFCF